MAWTVPITFVDGDPLTAAQLNTFLRDNLNATAPGIATTPGRLIVTAGKYQLAERQWVQATKRGVVTCDSPWPSDPAEEGDPGPSVTFQHGGQFLALYDARIRPLGGVGVLNYAPVIEGDTDNTPSVYRTAVRSNRTSIYYRTGGFYWFTGLEPGVTTVTMKYGNTPGADAATEHGDFAERRLTVIPF